MSPLTNIVPVMDIPDLLIAILSIPVVAVIAYFLGRNLYRWALYIDFIRFRFEILSRGNTSGKLLIMKKRCPICHKRKGVREFVYGMPINKLDTDKYLLGGCCVSDDMPDYRCITCVADFYKESDNFHIRVTWED